MESLLLLVPPAIIISFALFLGKIIADNNPLSDDLKWIAEHSAAIFFCLFVALPGLIGYGLAKSFTLNFSPLGREGYIFAIILILSALIFIRTEKEDLVFGSVKIKTEKEKRQLTIEKEVKRLLFPIISLLRHDLSPLILNIFLSYIVTCEALSGSLVWAFGALIGSFLILTVEADIFSLTDLELPKAIIHPVGSKEPITDVKIIRYAGNSVHFYQKNTLVLMEKSQISKIEVDSLRERSKKARDLK